MIAQEDNEEEATRQRGQDAKTPRRKDAKTQGLSARAPSSLPRLRVIGIDGGVLLFAAALSVVTGLGGVERAGWTSQLPLGGNFDRYGIQIEGKILANPAIPLQRGRTITDADVRRAPPIVLINPTFAGVVVVLVAVALTACWAPAWRATRVSPLEAIRGE